MITFAGGLIFVGCRAALCFTICLGSLCNAKWNAVCQVFTPVPSVRRCCKSLFSFFCHTVCLFPICYAKRLPNYRFFPLIAGSIGGIFWWLLHCALAGAAFVGLSRWLGRPSLGSVGGRDVAWLRSFLLELLPCSARTLRCFGNLVGAFAKLR